MVYVSKIGSVISGADVVQLVGDLDLFLAAKTHFRERGKLTSSRQTGKGGWQERAELSVFYYKIPSALCLSRSRTLGSGIWRKNVFLLAGSSSNIGDHRNCDPLGKPLKM